MNDRKNGVRRFLNAIQKLSPAEYFKKGKEAPESKSESKFYDFADSQHLEMHWGDLFYKYFW
jgi:hypothetical protein